MKKACSRCRKILAYEKFHKDRSKPSGYNSTCKSCVAQRDRKRVTYTTMKKVKDVVRGKSKRLYAGMHECAVLSCTAKAQLHHIDYEDAREVIPLCPKHHRQVHHLETLMKHIEEIKGTESDGK